MKNRGFKIPFGYVKSLLYYHNMSQDPAYIAKKASKPQRRQNAYFKKWFSQIYFQADFAENASMPWSLVKS